MARDEKDTAEKAKGTVTREVQVDSAVDDPNAQREDDTAKQRSTSPIPREGDTWEQIHTDPERNGPQRRVGVLAYTDEGPETQVPVEDKVTRRLSHIRRDRFEPPHWRFVG